MSHRALYLTPIYDPQVGGAAVHFEQITQGLMEEGTIESYTVISSYAPEAPLFERTDGGRVFRVLFSPKSIHRRWSKHKVALNYLIATVFTVLALLLCRVTVVHTHTKPYFSLPVWIARSYGSKIIIDGQDLGSPSFPLTGDVFVSISENIKQKALDRNERIETIPVGIDPETLAVSCDEVETPSDPYLLYVGDITDRKGVPELLKAHESLSEEISLLLIGEHVNSSINLENRANVHYLGTRSHMEVLCYIRSADLVILPSKEEALGRVILESLFHKTPVVCPPGVPEYQRHIPDTVVSPVEPCEIKNAIDSGLRKQEGASEYPLDRHFTSNVVSEYGSLYASLHGYK